jgi:20S proteasome alpha/beta subunit
VFILKRVKAGLFTSQKNSKDVKFRRKRYPLMTFVIGMKCYDGLVLCADSLEEDGIVKKQVNKIVRIDNADWGIALGGSGGGGIIDKFSDEVKVRLPNKILDRYKIESVIEELLAEFKMKYKASGDAFSIIVAFYEKTTGANYLYRADGEILSPVQDSAHVGTGNDLWSLISTSIYDKRNSVEDNIKVAAFAARLAIRYAHGVGEPIQVVSYAEGDKDWKRRQGINLDVYLRLTPNADSIAAVIQEWWKTFNPPTHVEQVKKFGTVKIPGDELTLLTGVKIEELETGAGRNRVSGFLFGNRDKLRKRGILERERDQKTG